LLDSGADCTFVSQKIVDDHNLPVSALEDSIPLRLADGSLTSAISRITNPIQVCIGDYSEYMTCYFTSLDPYDIVLGHLYQHNLSVNLFFHGSTNNQPGKNIQEERKNKKNNSKRKQKAKEFCNTNIDEHLQLYNKMKQQMDSFNSNHRFMDPNDYNFAVQCLKQCFIRIRDEKNNNPVLQKKIDQLRRFEEAFEEFTNELDKYNRTKIVTHGNARLRFYNLCQPMD
jgi:hypothetical protein